MTHWLRLALALAALVPCFDACDGGSSADGSTSWLSPCEDSSACIGGLECICGVCTKRCDTSRDCDALEPGAVCTSARGAGDCSADEAKSTVCARRALDAGIAQPGTGGSVSTGGRPARVDAGIGGRAQPETGSAPATDASSETPTVAPRTLPLGSPGWRDSMTPFCSEIVGNTTLRIQSTPDAVYVVTDSTCNTLDTAGCVPSNPVDNEIFYRNDGKGWRTLYRRPGGAAKLVGFMDGGVVVIGGGSCAVSIVSEAGERCLSAGADAGTESFTAGAVAGDGSLILLGATDNDTGKTALVRYDGATWSRLKTWTGEEPRDIALYRTRIFIAGSSQFLWSGDIESGGFAPVPRVPANDYSNVWALSDSELIATDGIGRLNRWNGGQWTLIDTGFSDAVTRLWGPSDGPVFAITQSKFGRYMAGAFKSIANDTPDSVSYYFADLTGNSANEVFLAGVDRSARATTCGSTFLVWYDGTTFHQF